MDAWVAVVLHDHFQHTDSPFNPPAASRAAGVNQTGNVISGGNHGQ
jgi:hypothetical protein